MAKIFVKHAVIGCGTVMAMLVALDSAHASKFTVLYSFGTKNGDDGMYPEGSLIRDKAGNLYGTTQDSSNGHGAVFKLAPDGTETMGPNPWVPFLLTRGAICTAPQRAVVDPDAEEAVAVPCSNSSQTAPWPFYTLSMPLMAIFPDRN